MTAIISINNLVIVIEGENKKQCQLKKECFLMQYHEAACSENSSLFPRCSFPFPALIWQAEALGMRGCSETPLRWAAGV